jgi:hypothetical protein
MADEERCVICDEAITNPICPSCLERQVMHWVGEKKPSLVPILKDVGASVKTFEHANTSCIICNGSMNVCAHCYCKEIYTWLLENEYEVLAEKFLESFNFELDYRFDLKAPREKDEGVT